jgi:hypothetical protein
LKEWKEDNTKVDALAEVAVEDEGK